MLYRILNVRQNENENFKLWFTDDFWDLFVWVGKDKKVSAFHLSYGKPNNEKILTWKKRGSFSHAKVLDGEQHASTNMAPILVKDGIFKGLEIEQRFIKDSKKINPSIMWMRPRK